MTTAPATRYVRDAGTDIAYQVLGTSDHDLLYVPTATHPIDLMWDDPVLARGLHRLSTSFRLIACDLRGVGSSDPMWFTAVPVMQAWADGLGAVLDATGSERASIVAMAESSLPVMLYAASHPERVRSLVLSASYARYERAPDYPDGMPESALAHYLEAFHEAVGAGGLVDYLAPSRRDDQRFRDWWARGERLSAGRGYFLRILDLFLRTDVRPALESIQAPTLVVRRTGDPHVRAGHARYLADRIGDTRLVELPGADHAWFSGDSDAWLGAVEEFVTGERSSSTISRVLATVLFTDIVGSTEQAAAVGDAEWTTTLEAHDALLERQITAFRGTVVKYTGDGVMATFDGPARAIECARELVRGVRSLGVEIRAGLHTGEVEMADADVHGIAVHIAARILALAESGEVLVSGSIPPLVLGSGLRFEDRGMHTLKGVPDEWQVFLVEGE
jgi:class 3 adenylate cyclase